MTQTYFQFPNSFENIDYLYFTKFKREYTNLIMSSDKYTNNCQTKTKRSYLADSALSIS